MTTWAIGDIHGCSQALESVFAAADPKKSDTIIFLGDYIDRGPDSYAVIDWLIKMKASGYNIITLRGNHEVMMLKACSDLQIMSGWLQYGGNETLDSYQVGSGHQWQQHIPELHWQFLHQTEPYYETQECIFVHAGLAPDILLSQQQDEYLYWRHQILPIAHISAKKLICGHSAQTNGLIGNFGHTLLVDTFAYGGQWLSCLNVDSGEYWQANQDGEVRCQRIEPL